MSNAKGLYLHYKGSLYVVTGVRTNANNADNKPETDRRLIDYSSLTAEVGMCFSRAASEFFEQVIWRDGLHRARFVRVQDLAHAVYLYRNIFELRN